MDVTKFFKEYNRMCEKYAKGSCVGCPLKNKDCFGYLVRDSLKN